MLWRATGFVGGDAWLGLGGSGVGTGSSCVCAGVGGVAGGGNRTLGSRAGSAVGGWPVARRKICAMCMYAFVMAEP